MQTFGLGIDIEPEYSLNKTFSVYGSAGFTNFFGKSFRNPVSNSKISNVSLIPVLFGAKVYAITQLFIGIKAGVGFLTGEDDAVGALTTSLKLVLILKSYRLSLGYNTLIKNGESLSNYSLALFYNIR